MTYQALARKYRPQNFQQIVGQEHVVQALVNGIENNRLHHAFLFTGTRGVGKTTLARVLAKSLNCLEGVSGNPCGVCQHCEEIKSGEFIDLIEVDAASRTGVDDTRTLLENVQYAPNKGQYKIYLIDEVHMFSKSSFNALLKTLEEPPEHVKFLLATTEPEKLPVTVLSRCLQFNLKRLTQKQISDHLKDLLERESVSFEEPALELVARAADGSMRDALSLLDQSLAFGAGQINLAEINQMLGTIEQIHVTDLLQMIHTGEKDKVFEKLQWFHDMSIDHQLLLDELCLLLHEVAMTQSLGRVTGGSQFDAAAVKSLAQSCPAEVIQWYQQLVVLALGQMQYTPSKKICFETAIIRLLDFESGQVKKKPGENVTGLNKQAAKQTAPQPPRQTPQKATPQVAASKAVPEPTAEPAKASPPSPAFDTESLTPANWTTMMPRLGLRSTAAALAGHVQLLEMSDSTITFGVETSAESMLTPRAKQGIIDRLNAGPKQRTVRFEMKHQVDSLNQRQQKAAEEETEQVVSDPVVSELINQFGAKIIENQ